MPLVLEEYPNVKLVILGRENSKATFKKQFIGSKSETKLSANSILCRKVSEFYIMQLRTYASSHQSTNPSNSRLEAMSMDKPVVVGGHGVAGFKEQVIASGLDQNGVHVNGNDPADIAWGIKQVSCNSERAKKWGENGRKRVLRYFIWRKTAEQTLEVYKAVISDVGVLTVDKEVKKTLS